MTRGLLAILLSFAALIAPASAAPPANNEAVTQFSTGVILNNATNQRVTQFSTGVILNNATNIRLTQISVGLVLIAGPATPPGATTVIFPAPLTHFR